MNGHGAAQGKWEKAATLGRINLLFNAAGPPCQRSNTTVMESAIITARVSDFSAYCTSYRQLISIPLVFECRAVSFPLGFRMVLIVSIQETAVREAFCPLYTVSQEECAWNRRRLIFGFSLRVFC